MRDASGGPPADRADLFDLLHHFDGGLDHLTDPSERQAVVALYTAGAQRAVNAAAFHTAERHSATGLALLGDGAPLERWLPLARSRAWALRALGDLDGSTNLFDQAQSRTDDIGALSDFYGVLADLHASLNQAQESFAVGLAALAAAGRPLPESATIPKVLWAMLRVKLALGRRTPEDIGAMPDGTDPDALLRLELLMRAAPAAFQTSPNHYPLLISEMIQLHATHGVSRHGCFSFAGYAVLLCAFGDVEAGLRWADVALQTRDRTDERVLEAVLYASVYWTVAHWRQHLSECVPMLVQGAVSGLDHGDVQFMGTCAGFSTVMTWLTGAQLDDVVASWDEWSPYYDRHDHKVGHAFGSIYRQITHNLQEPTTDPLQLAGPFWDERERIPENVDQKRLLELHLVWAGKALLAWAWGRPAEAAEAAEQAITYEAAAPSFPCHAAVHCAASMGALATWADRSPAARRAALKRTHATLKMLRKHEHRAPMNLAWRRMLVEAELERVEGRESDAMRSWEAGAAAAQEHGYRSDAAAANLRIAHHLRSQGRERLARVFLADGWYLMRRWGAHARAAALKASEPWLESDVDRGGLTSAASTTVTTTQVAGSLDADAVIKATRAISSEIELGPLVSHLLAVCCENAGARRGAILMGDPAAPTVAGVQDLAWLDVGTPLDQAAPIPRALVRYVWRTGEPLVLDDAAHKGPFTDDPDVQAGRLRSVLLVPLTRQGVVEGVVFLDNTLVAGAFTADRARLVDVLAGQAAISVRNAQLYADQVAQARAFERFVPRDFLASLGHTDVGQVERGDGVEKDMAVLFTDLRGFTDLSEGMAPGDLMAFLNRHLGFMEPEITRHGGFIDKFIGDAILALFAEGADAAVRAGIAMQRAHARFNAERQARGEAPVGLGLGVHHGPLTLGTIGGRDRLSCTVLGDTVNLASRVESLTKTYGAPMLITDATVRALPDPARYRLRTVDRVAVKGRQGSVELVEVLDALPEPEADRRDAHAPLLGRARAAWKAGAFADAGSLTRQILAADPDDVPARRLNDHATRMEAQGAPEGWDGVLRLRHK